MEPLDSKNLVQILVTTAQKYQPNILAASRIALDTCQHACLLLQMQIQELESTPSCDTKPSCKRPKLTVPPRDENDHSPGSREFLRNFQADLLPVIVSFLEPTYQGRVRIACKRIHGIMMGTRIDLSAIDGCLGKNEILPLISFQKLQDLPSDCSCIAGRAYQSLRVGCKICGAAESHADLAGMGFGVPWNVTGISYALDDVADFIDVLNTLAAASSLTTLRVICFEEDMQELENGTQILSSVSKLETLCVLDLNDFKIHGGLSPLSRLANPTDLVLNEDEFHGSL